MLKQNVGLILNLGVSLLIHIHPLHPMSALIETAQLRTLKSFPESKTADWIRGSSQDKNPTYGHFDVFTAVFGEFHAGWIFFRSQKKIHIEHFSNPSSTKVWQKCAGKKIAHMSPPAIAVLPKLVGTRLGKPPEWTRLKGDVAKKTKGW